MKYANKVTKVVSMGLLILLLSFVLVDIFPSAKAAINFDGCDTIIILDSSGSMGSVSDPSDPNRIAIEAGKLFIDNNETTDSYVAFISFSTGVNNVVDFKKLDSQANRDAIKKEIDQTKYYGDTDIGGAFQKAVELIHAHNKKFPNRDVSVLFLSDGGIRFYSNQRTDEEQKQLETESQNKLDKALEDLGSMQIPVYAIGLSSSNRYLDRNTLQTIASKTNGKTWFTNRAKDLPGILMEIFAMFSGSFVKKGTETIPAGKTITRDIEISSPTIYETNVMVVFDSKDDASNVAVSVLNPDGKKVSFNSKDTVISESSNYMHVKLIRPKVGTWKLVLKNKSDFDITVTVMNLDYINFRLSMEVDADNHSYINDDIPNITHLDKAVFSCKFVMSDGTDVDPELNSYESATAKLFVKYSEDSDPDVYDATFSAEDQEFITEEIDLSNEKYYTESGCKIWFELYSGSVDYDSDIYKVKLNNSVPEKAVKKIRYKADQDEQCIDNIMSYFKDRDGDLFSVTLADGQSEYAVLDNDTLVIKKAAENIKVLHFVVTDTHNATAFIDIRIKAVSLVREIITWSCIGLLIIAVAALILWIIILRKRGSLAGKILHISGTINESMNINVSILIGSKPTRNGKWARLSRLLSSLDDWEIPAEKKAALSAVFGKSKIRAAKAGDACRLKTQSGSIFDIDLRSGANVSFGEDYLSIELMPNDF